MVLGRGGDEVRTHIIKRARPFEHITPPKRRRVRIDCRARGR